MPGKKRKSRDLVDCLNRLLLCRHETKSVAAYTAFAESLSDLISKVYPYYYPDEHGKYKVIPEDAPELFRSMYLDTIRKAEAFGKAADKDKNAEGMRYVASKIGAVLGDELNAFSSVMPGDKVTLPELGRKTVTHTVMLDEKIKTTGLSGHLSNRIPITYTAPDGRQIKGFFTENTVLDEWSEIDSLIDNIAGDNEAYRNALRALSRDRQYSDRYYNHYTTRISEKKQALLDGDTLMFSPELSYGTVPKEVAAPVMNDPAFHMAALKFTQALIPLSRKKYAFKNIAQVPENSKVETRNAALSAVADLLGMSHLIARSVRMKVTDGTTVKEGVFMEYAEGSNAQDLKDNDPLLQTVYTRQSRSNPGQEVKDIHYSADFLRQIADIQVLDYICGNTDRHAGNLMLTTGPDGKGNTCVTGLKGIDNDLAFGTIGAVDDLQHHMVGPAHMGFVSRETAERVLALTKDSLTAVLKDHDLSKAEIDAAWERTRYMQQHLALALGPDKSKAKITVIDGSFADHVKEISAFAKQHKDSYFKALLKDIDKGIIKPDAPEEDGPEANGIDHQLKQKYPELYAKDAAAQTGRLIETTYTEPSLQEKNDVLHHRLYDMLKEMKTADSGFFIGSTEFSRVKDALSAALKNEEVHTKTNSIANYEKSITAYKTLIDMTDKYLKKKELEELELIKKGKTPSQNAEKRTKFAEKLIEFASERLDVLDEMKEAQGKLYDSSMEYFTTMCRTAENEMLQAIEINDIDERNIAFAKYYDSAMRIHMLEGNKDTLSNSEMLNAVSVSDPDHYYAVLSANEGFCNAVEELTDGQFKAIATDPDYAEEVFGNVTDEIALSNVTVIDESMSADNSMLG